VSAPVAFCTQCGPLRVEDDAEGCAVSPIDGFGECRFCGSDTCTWEALLGYLAAQGLRVAKAEG